MIEFFTGGGAKTEVPLQLECQRGVEYLLFSLQGGSREQHRRDGNAVCKMPFAHRGPQCIGMLTVHAAGAAMRVFHEVTANLIEAVADAICLDIA